MIRLVNFVKYMENVLTKLHREIKFTRFRQIYIYMFVKYVWENEWYNRSEFVMLT